MYSFFFLGFEFCDEDSEPAINWLHSFIVASERKDDCVQARKQNVHERATRIELKDLSTDEQIRLEAERWEKA